ncbi:hypothetical protein COV81_02035 [Candidatus Peregrinibacteria bacterium CG11_big_fil_rev_8_21_14_0_20_41_10]|nr:MAG: hypothetical protein COV81_02035 [Candidatus Peregrinibacteria bacterium CG11_big_fil_rev_8_21_14_0_20_41_10]PIZ76333.1 MAG: hypothetical protein COY06_02050 [Candidatus Peregrinibacteria bacterium CG_4_10_14_0_2_um_filter_41_8]PJC37612.1 MAG: hypothetical protein CO045_04475 [Candidatus Peregrinibacteria bacterium CG_4_9_14_0_2_um_filter_41_14]
MKAPKWQRYRNNLKQDAGKNGQVLACTFVNDNWLALVKLNDKNVLLQAVKETAVLAIGDCVKLVLRKGEKVAPENPLQYRLKVEKI